jgi:hypothetical protein
MEQIPESVTSNVKNTEPNTSNDTNSEKEVTLSTPLPNVVSLVLLFLSTLAIIYAGYIHGNMHLITTLKNAKL